MNTIMSLLYKPHAIILIPIYHCILELCHLFNENLKVITKYIFVGVISFLTVSSFGYHIIAKRCLYWIILGVASSIGFGFGMHTFVLFLAPHIAAVTVAAHKCKSLNFPEPPYPSDIMCPDVVDAHVHEVTFIEILQKVGLESFMWGLGTAIGELPPYLAARLRAQVRNAGGDEPGSRDQVAGWELWMIKIINKVGFVGILLCAAIPNPLFDAAGVASGIAQIPFLTFFGATLIGKAVIKVLLQSSFVVLAFHSNNLDSLVGHADQKLGQVFPILKDLNLKGKLSEILEEQRTSVVTKQLTGPKRASIISEVFNWIILVCCALFIMSLINALDKQYKERTKGKARSDRKKKIS